MGEEITVEMTAPVKALLEAVENKISCKIYHAEALKGASAPFVFWLQVNEDEDEDLAGLTGLRTDSYEFHCCARTLAELNALSYAVRSALFSVHGTVKNGYVYERITVRMTSPVLHEKEVGLYRKVYLATIHYQEE